MPPQNSMNDDEIVKGGDLGQIERNGSRDSYHEAGHTHTPEEEKRLVRKIDMYILPWIIVIYALSYLDRSNLGNSVALGLKTDLHLVGDQYELAGAIFYVATFTFGTLGGLMLKVVPPRIWMAGCCVGWGMMAALQAACHNFTGIMVVRFFLGVFEASFAPGCAYYLSFWYTREELALRIAAYAGSSCFSGVIGGLVSYGIGLAHTPLQGWQLLFIVEGIPTVTAGFATWFILPNRPELIKKSRIFTDHQLAIARDRRNRYVRVDPKEGINWAQFGYAFKDYRMWLLAVIFAGQALSLAVISVFLPTLLGTMGFDTLIVNLMTVPVYAVGYFGLLLISWLSNRYMQRGIPIAITGLIGGVGYLLVGLQHSHGVRFFGSFMVVSGTYWNFPIVLAWISNTFAADTKSGTGIGIAIALGHAAGVAASNIYPSNEAPLYTKGACASAGVMFLTAICTVVLRFSLKYENERRDRLYGKPVAGQALTLGDDADKNTSHRYVL